MGTVKIISRSTEPFANRQEAGRLLADHLKKYSGKNTVVLGIPRGGIAIAVAIADKLQADFDVVLSHKLGAPYNPEFAIGAVCEDGTFFVNTKIAPHMGADEKYIEKEKANQLQRMLQRVQQYRTILPKLDLKGRTAIITDDGIATGASLQAAAWAVKKENPQKIILAIPVGPKDSVTEISQDADETICLRVPSYFQALSEFYRDFGQVEDDELLEILKNYENKRGKK